MRRARREGQRCEPLPFVLSARSDVVPVSAPRPLQCRDDPPLRAGCRGHEGCAAAAARRHAAGGFALGAVATAQPPAPEGPAGRADKTAGRHASDSWSRRRIRSRSTRAMRCCARVAVPSTRRSPCNWCSGSSNRSPRASAAARSCWSTTRGGTGSSPMTDARPRPPPRARTGSSTPTASRCSSTTPSSVAGRSAFPGPSRCSRRPTGATVGCHGRICSCLRSSWHRTAFASRPRLHAVIAAETPIRSAARPRLLLRRGRAAARHRRLAREPGVRGDAAPDRHRRREGVLRGRDRARHRRHGRSPIRQIRAT